MRGLFLSFVTIAILIPESWALTFQREDQSNLELEQEQLQITGENCGSKARQSLPTGKDWRNLCMEREKSGNFQCTPERHHEDVCLNYTCAAEIPEHKEWVTLTQPLPTAQNNKKPRLAFLFMLYDQLGNHKVWYNWMKQAEEQGHEFDVYIHTTKEGGLGAQAGQKYFQKYWVGEIAESHRCNNLGVEWLLMNKALKNEKVTHLALASYDTVPLKPLGYIYDQLAKDSATRLCMDWNWRVPRAEMWWMMRREDVHHLTANQKMVDAKAVGFRKRCDDENSWLYPLALRSYKYGQEKAPLLDECVMFTDWSGSCKDFAAHVEKGNFTNLRQADAHIANYKHPKQYYKVNASAVQELLDSSYWWGRKFAKDAFDPNDFPWKGYKEPGLFDNLVR